MSGLGTRKVYEDDRVVVWHLDLEPGEQGGCTRTDATMSSTSYPVQRSKFPVPTGRRSTPSMWKRAVSSVFAWTASRLFPIARGKPPSQRPTVRETSARTRFEKYWSNSRVDHPQEKWRASRICYNRGLCDSQLPAEKGFVMSRRMQHGWLTAACLLAGGLTCSHPRTAQAQSGPRAPGHRGPECLNVDQFFADEVWAKVGERTCLKCHNAKGDASDSEFLLQDTARGRSTRADTLRHNRTAFLAYGPGVGRRRVEGRVEAVVEDSRRLGSRGGGKVFDEDSTGYRILSRFVRRGRGEPDNAPPFAEYDAPPYFDGIEMIPPRRLLRRLTLSLAGRLPTKEEQAKAATGGLQAVDALLDDILPGRRFLREAARGVQRHSLDSWIRRWRRGGSQLHPFPQVPIVVPAARSKQGAHGQGSTEVLPPQDDRLHEAGAPVP